jgi:hypothetical protein
MKFATISAFAVAVASVTALPQSGTIDPSLGPE